VSRFCFTPQYLFTLQLLIVILTEPAHDAAKWSMVQPETDADWLNKSSVAMALPTACVQPAFSVSQNDTAPQVASMLRNMDLSSEDLGALSYSVGVDGKDEAQAAADWIAANGRPASLSPQGPLQWITKAKSALGRNDACDRSWLMDWLKRGGRSLGDPAKNPWCGDFVGTCIHMGLPDDPLLGAVGTNPYWGRNWLLFG
jgi:hypothetical protein